MEKKWPNQTANVRKKHFDFSANFPEIFPTTHIVINTSLTHLTQGNTSPVLYNNNGTHLMNMSIPVGSIALDMPFHEAIMLYFCLAVNGSRGSGGPGLGGSSSLSLCLPPPPSPDAVELANFPRSQPMPAAIYSPRLSGGVSPQRGALPNNPSGAVTFQSLARAVDD